MTRAVMPILIAVAFLLSGAVPVEGQEIKGQRPVMMIGDAFQFNQGSWATYTLHDKRDDSYSSMTMSILESVRRGEKDCAWMEVEIETENELVVTRGGGSARRREVGVDDEHGRGRTVARDRTTRRRVAGCAGERGHRAPLAQRQGRRHADARTSRSRQGSSHIDLRRSDQGRRLVHRA
jgi:hypothetical protein